MSVSPLYEIAQTLRARRVTSPVCGTPPKSAFEFGYQTGKADRHYMRTVEAKVVDAEPDGYVMWLAGWRAGQLERRP